MTIIHWIHASVVVVVKTASVRKHILLMNDGGIEWFLLLIFTWGVALFIGIIQQINAVSILGATTTVSQ